MIGLFEGELVNYCQDPNEDIGCLPKHTAQAGMTTIPLEKNGSSVE